VNASLDTITGYTQPYIHLHLYFYV